MNGRIPSTFDKPNNQETEVPRDTEDIKDNSNFKDMKT